MSFSGYVFIDLETTGLDDKNDRIIEIGAVKTDAKLKEVARFQTLVNPEKLIPYQVTVLTRGLDNDLVKDAPKIDDVKQKFLDFIGDLPIVAHNSDFERGFLKRQVNPDISNKFLDTMELLALFFPSAESLKLDNFIKKLGIRDSENHRGLDDAEDLHKVMLHVVDKIRTDNNWYLVALRLISYFRDSGWPWEEFIRTLMPATPPKEIAREYNEEIKYQTGELKLTQFSVEHEHLASLITDPLEERTGQKEYVKHICESFNQNASMMIEAGTGIGKTLAYLLPTLSWTKSNSGTVIISTKTKMLQNQIMENDIPLAKKLLSLDNLKAIKVQGRSNYLCIRKMDRFFADLDLTDEFESKFSKLFFYSLDKLSGVADFTKIPVWVKKSFPHVYRMLDILCADASNCLQSKCSYYGDCHYFRMVRDAKKADVIVANHSLIMSWPAHLPKGDKIIFDEAHNLQNEATESSTIEMNSLTIGNILFVIQDEKGKGILSELKKMDVPRTLIAGIEQDVERLKMYDSQIGGSYRMLFSKIFHLLKKKLNPDYPEKMVLYSPTSVYGYVSLTKHDEWDTCLKLFIDIMHMFEKLYDDLDAVAETVNDDEYAMIIKSLMEKIETVLTLLRQTVALSKPNEPLSDFVFWLTWDDRKGYWALSRAFIDVGHILATQVYPNYTSCIFTSATLKAGTKSLSSDIGFDRITGRVITDEVITIPSPFNYKDHSAMFFLKGTVNPADRDFIKQLSSTIVDAAELLGGKTLVLFSNRRRLRMCFETLIPLLVPKGFKLLSDEMGGDVVNYFMSENKAVLIGSETFGEGLDIKGDKLSCVILERMPVVMRTPVYTSREDLYKVNKGRNTYTDFELPQRLLKLRQWSGRLIRSNTDKGTVIVYDRWFVDQKSDIQQRVVDAVAPMPVELKSTDEIIFEITKKYLGWDYKI